MARIYSPELKYVIEEALESAELLGDELNSLHLLFAMYMLDNSGGMLLIEEGFSEEALLPHVDRSLQENQDAVEEVMELAEEISENYRSREVNCLHLVISICRHRNTMAYRTLQIAGVPVPKLRSRAVALLADMPKRYMTLFEMHRRRKQHTVSVSANVKQKQQSIEAGQISPKSVTLSNPQKSARRTAKPITSTFPVLNEIGINLVEKAQMGELEGVIGRDFEMDELCDILNKRKSNNPLVIGPPGVGKTALIEGLAHRIAHNPEQLPGLEGRLIFQLDVSRMLKGTHLRGSFSERMDALRNEVISANGQVILFLDEIHTISQGSVDGSQEIAQELKSSLARGEMPFIGATTLDEYKKSIERDTALSRRFHVLELSEPNKEETLEILANVSKRYASHHNVEFPKSSLKLAAKLSDRYMRDRFQPDKSLTILDLCGSRARRAGIEVVDTQIVAEVVSKLTAVPLDQLVTDEKSRYLNLEQHLAKNIIGHKEVLARIAEALRRNVAGFGGDRPMGSFLFVGPTGVGKTEIARSLAKELFGSADSMIRLDMSEYSEPHSVSKLIGSPPGYVGFQEGGALTDAMRRKPFQLVLFDEIEKAHPDVHQLLLQVLDDGRLSDNMGRTVDFTNAVIIMTSNIGADVFTSNKRSIGFADDTGKGKRQRTLVLEAVRKAFAPELYNRIDEKMVFDPLEKDDIIKIAMLLLNSTAQKLKAEKQISLEFSKDVPMALADGGGYDVRYGARPMRRTIQAKIEGPLASMILKGDIRHGDKVRVSPGKRDRFVFVTVDNK